MADGLIEQITAAIAEAEASAYERGRADASNAALSPMMEATMLRAFADAMASTAKSFEGTRAAAALDRIVRRTRREADDLLSPVAEPDPAPAG